MKQTQVDFVKNHLARHGEISRNFCLSNYISRLAAIIAILKSEGDNFETEERPTVKPDGSKGTDFVYKLVPKSLF